MLSFLTACRVGFNGPNCSETCVYPGYGRDCQMTCHCNEQFCSHINGCNTSNEGIYTCTLCHDLLRFMIEVALFISEAKKFKKGPCFHLAHTRERYQIY